MIKWDGFLKLLKQLFFGLLISCFILLGGSFVSAVGAFTEVGVVGFNSPVDSSYHVSALKGGGFSSSYLGVGKSVLALSNQRLFWWSTNGYPYVYLKGGVYVGTTEGFFDRYYSCDLLTGAGVPSNCSYSMIDYSGGTSDFDEQVFRSFFKNVVQGDKFYVNSEDYRYVGGTWNYTLNYIRVCWNSEEIGQSICFMGGLCTPGNDTYCKYLGGLVNSQNLNGQFENGLTYGLLNNNWIGYAPGQVGYGGIYEGDTAGSSQGVINGSYTGDYTYGECTYKQIVDRLEEDGFSKYFCYGGLDNFDLYNPSLTYSPIPGSGKTLNQIWVNAKSTWDTPQEWYDFWNGLYVDRYSSQNWSDMWSSYPAVYRTWFDLYYTYGGDKKYFPWVLEYCNIVLNYDSLSNSVYKGDTFNGVCETIIDENRSGILGSGEIIQGLNWNGVGGLSGSKTYSDPGVFITDMFTKIKSYIPTDLSNTGFGFLPVYIISFMLFLMLFRFLSH